MPHFETRKPPEADEPGKLRVILDAGRQRILAIAGGLRNLLAAGKRRTLPAARRFGDLVVTNRLRISLVGGAVLLLVAAIPVGFVIGSSDGTGNGEEVVIGGSSGRGEGAGSETGAVFVGPDTFAESVKRDDIGDGDLVFQTGYGEVWAMTASGSEPARLAEVRKTYPAASLSPDGEKIAYVRDTGNTSSIHVVGSDGTDPTLVREFPFGSLGPDWRTQP